MVVTPFFEERQCLYFYYFSSALFKLYKPVGGFPLLVRCAKICLLLSGFLYLFIIQLAFHYVLFNALSRVCVCAEMLRQLRRFSSLCERRGLSLLGGALNPSFRFSYANVFRVFSEVVLISPAMPFLTAFMDFHMRLLQPI